MTAKRKILHIGDPGTVMAKCGAKPTSMRSALADCDEALKSNWVYKPEAATCKRCLVMYNKAVRKNMRGKQ